MIGININQMKSKVKLTITSKEKRYKVFLYKLYPFLFAHKKLIGKIDNTRNAITVLVEDIKRLSLDEKATPTIIETQKKIKDITKNKISDQNEYLSIESLFTLIISSSSFYLNHLIQYS